jgi:hypothetical protein
MNKRMPVKKLKKTFRKIESAMAASAFAEAGEFDTAREMMKEERRVLLALRYGLIDKKTLRYAYNTAKRIGAKLDILYISSIDTVDYLLGQFITELEKEGIVYHLIRRSGCLKKQIIDYSNSENDILFVVIESSENLDTDCSAKNRRLSKDWNNLKCPLVVVMDTAR